MRDILISYVTASDCVVLHENHGKCVAVVRYDYDEHLNDALCPLQQ